MTGYPTSFIGYVYSDTKIHLDNSVYWILNRKMTTMSQWRREMKSARTLGHGFEPINLLGGDEMAKRTRVGGRLAAGSFFANGTLALLGTIMACADAWAFEIDSGNPDVQIRWDNTVKYSSAWRLQNPSTTLTANSNLNDGDANFKKGLISNRVDLLSEFDLSYQNVGLRVSGAAWYDAQYNRNNDHPNDGTANQSSVPYNQFTDATRKLHGRDAELLDAFVFAKFNLGEKPATLRAGKHSLVWGETLFFGANGIAGGMMPVDVVKLASVPNTQFKEAIRPVQMLSGQVQLNSDISLGGYYQFRWQGNRLPASGSYFSQVDPILAGGEQLQLGLPPALFPQPNAVRTDDQKAKNSGQGGLQLRIRDGGTDYGLYLLRFHDKGFQQVANIGLMPMVFIPGCPVPGSVATGPASCAMPGVPVSYRLVHHEGITAFGGSFSHTFGDMNLAGEASVRHNQPLASSQAVDTSALGGSITNNSSNPAYAVGKTAHLNLSALWSLPRTALFSEATFLGEIAWNRAMHIDKNATALDRNATRDAVALRMIFEPTYRQVVSGLDLSIPIGLGYAPRGSRSMALGPGAFPADGGGDISIGVNGTYLDAWRFGLSYTHYFGPEQTFLDATNNFTYKQSLKDRDFIAFSLRRTF